MTTDDVIIDQFDAPLQPNNADLESLRHVVCSCAKTCAEKKLMGVRRRKDIKKNYWELSQKKNSVLLFIFSDFEIYGPIYFSSLVLRTYLTTDFINNFVFLSFPRRQNFVIKY